MNRSQGSAVVLAVAAALLVPLPAGAQLGGLIKKKVSDAIKTPDKPQPSVSASRPAASPFNSDVLEMSPSLTATVMRSMDAELAMQAEFRKELAKYPTPQAYAECQAKAQTSPEGQKIASAIGTVPDNATPDDLQKIVLKMGADMEVLTKKSCPFNPDDWNDSRRKQHIVEIHLKASAPFDTIGARGDGRLMNNEMGTRRNDVLTERIVAYCEAKAAGMDVSGDAEGLKIPGTGKNIYYVYTAEELAVLATIDCARFLEKYKKLTQ